MLVANFGNFATPCPISSYRPRFGQGPIADETASANPHSRCGRIPRARSSFRFLAVGYRAANAPFANPGMRPGFAAEDVILTPPRRTSRLGLEIEMTETRRALDSPGEDG